MHFNPDKCPECGCDPMSTDELIPGDAYMDRQPDGSFEYTGSTEVCWDAQQSVTDAEGKVTLKCKECGIRWQAEKTE
jgi:hypothetical protein